RILAPAADPPRRPPPPRQAFRTLAPVPGAAPRQVLPPSPRSGARARHGTPRRDGQHRLPAAAGRPLRAAGPAAPAAEPLLRQLVHAGPPRPPARRRGRDPARRWSLAGGHLDARAHARPLLPPPQARRDSLRRGSSAAEDH